MYDGHEKHYNEVSERLYNALRVLYSRFVHIVCDQIDIYTANITVWDFAESTCYTMH